MHEQRFDHLTRALSRRLPRRDVALLAGLAVGLLGGQPAQGQTLGKRRCGRRRCKPNTVCVKREGLKPKCWPIPVAGKRCFSDGPSCRNGAICVATGLSGEEVCTCPAGTSACGAFPETECVNLRTDPFHCGSCLNRCLAGVTTCCAVGPLEPGECVDTQSDARHCGGCGRTCGSNERCLGGACASTCRAGLTLCAGECVDTQTDANNCGTCARVCGRGPGETCCAGSCTNLASDFLNCFRCGRRCFDGQTCEGGSCTTVGSCRSEGQTCDFDIQCCDGLQCGSDGRCTPSSCVPYGQACTSAAGCCNNVPCIGGLCRFN